VKIYVVVEITNTMHKFAPLLYSYMLAPTCFGSSLPSSGSFWIRLSYVKIQISMAVYHIMWLNGLCVGMSWFRLNHDTPTRNSDGSRSSLKMADYCRNLYEPAYMNKAVVQICALCWLFPLRLIMHGTNIK
jgi:hypothetical protein